METMFMTGSPLPPAATDPWAFAVVSDLHLHEDRPGEATGVEKFRRVLAKLPTLAPRPELLLLLGDLHLEKLEALLPEVSLPIFPVAGNHESVANRRRLSALFPDCLGDGDYYAFERHDTLFLGLCTAAARDHVGHFESETIRPDVGQCHWLTRQLARRGEFRHCVLFGHIPPEAECRPNGMCLGENDGRFLHAQVKRYRPTALFFGHRHQRIDFTIDGVPVYGLPSCNWNFGGEPAGLLHVTATATGLDVRFIES